jgi:hypothetical protein
MSDWETYQTEHDATCPGCGVSSGMLHKSGCPDRWDAQMEADAKSGALERAFAPELMEANIQHLVRQWIGRERKLREASLLPGGYSDPAAMLAQCRRELQEAAGLVMSPAEVKKLIETKTAARKPLQGEI